jgi:hypothetical protein
VKKLPPRVPPKYWSHETSGVLKWAVECYLKNGQMTDKQIEVMREYLKQWIAAPVWSGGAKLAILQRNVDQIQTQSDIDTWLSAAVTEGIDPL